MSLRSISSRMVSSTLSLGSLSVISMLLGLISNMLIARHYSAVVFGTFVLLQVVVSFLTQISSLGLDLSIAKFIASTEDDVRKQDLVNTAILLRLSAVVVVGLVAWLGKILLLKLFNASMLTNLILFIPLLLFLEAIRNSLKSILQGSFRFSRIGITDLLTSSVYLILLLLFTLFSRSDVVGLILARAIALLTSGIYAFFSIPGKKKYTFNLSIIKEVVKFGFPLQLNDILHFIFTRVDTLVIGALLGPAEIAIYEFARKIPDSLRQLYEPFRSVYFSFSSKLFATDDREKAARLLNNSTRLVAFGTIMGAAVALLFGKEIIQLMFSSNYLQSAPIFMILMVNLSASLVGNVLGTTLVTVGESDKPVIVNIFNTVGSVLACVLLTPIWGITGAAIGTTFGTFAVFPAMMGFLRKKIDGKAIPYIKPMVIFCAWAALVLLIKPTSFLAKLGSITLFLVACFVLSVVTKGDMMFLLNFLNGTKMGSIMKLFPRGSR